MSCIADKREDCTRFRAGVSAPDNKSAEPLCTEKNHAVLAERSKALVSGTSSFGSAGSNPADRNYLTNTNAFLAEWSKALHSSRSHASGAGSNPAGCISIESLPAFMFTMCRFKLFVA